MLLRVLFLLVSMVTRDTMAFQLVSSNQTDRSARDRFHSSGPWINASGVFWKGEKVEGVQGGDENYDYEKGEEGGPALFRGGGEGGMGETHHGDVININYHIHEIVFSDDGAQKCLAPGTKCDGSVKCCGQPHGTDPDDNLCDPKLKKCVKCRPTVGDDCSGIGPCCKKEEDVYCYPREKNEPKGSFYNAGICRRITCIRKVGDKCDAKKKCCNNLECKSGQCKKCKPRGCSSTAGCCASYYCDKGACDCRRIGLPCSKEYPCCPPMVCSSGIPGGRSLAWRAAFDSVCVPRSNCADGTKPCTGDNACVNDVCLHKCVQTNFACGVKGDHRKCCKSGDYCHRTCENYCSGSYQKYCSDSKKQTTNCKCGAGSTCKRNEDCHGATCCHHRTGNCGGQGHCFKRPNRWILYPGGCLGGSKGASTGGKVSSTGGGTFSGASQANEGYVKCPF